MLPSWGPWLWSTMKLWNKMGRQRCLLGGYPSQVQWGGGGHIDIDLPPRYEMAHWPAMAAAWLRRQEGVRGIGGNGGRRPGRKCRRWPPGSGRGAFRWGAAGADLSRPWRAFWVMTIRAIFWPDFLSAHLGIHYWKACCFKVLPNPLLVLKDLEWSIYSVLRLKS